MYDISGDGIRHFSYNRADLTAEDFDSISKTLPNNVAIYRKGGMIGNSVRDTVEELAYACARTVRTFQQNPELDTLILVCPQFCIGSFDVTKTIHMKGFRDLDKGDIVKPREAHEINSLSLLQEFKSGQNYIRTDKSTDPETQKVTRTEVFESYTLGQVFEANDEFRNIVVQKSREEFRHTIKKIFVVTSSYYEESQISTLKAFHIILKGMYKALDITDSANLKSWVERYRRKGAKNYINGMVNSQKEIKQNLEYEMRSLKTQMNEYFRKLDPIDFFLRNPDTILEKIAEELINCEKLKDVSSAYLDEEGSFHVFTEHIYIKQPTNRTVISRTTTTEKDRVFENINENYYWDIGKLHITTYRDGKVTIVCNTRQVKGHGDRYIGHPHVTGSDNSVCLGDIKLAVYELINRHDYTALAGLLVNFAKSVNIGDMAGKYIRRWPVIQLNPS
jgi:hypothetical protein